MKTIYTALLVVSFAAIVMVGSASADTVNLVEKDGAWNVVSGGNYGTLTYSIDASEMLTYSFVVHDNDTLTGDHVLVVIAPELSGSGWPQTGSMALTGLSGTADISGLLGNINDGGDYDGSVYGAKIWYVPTTIFDGSKFTGWDQGNTLFEEDLITPATTPIPEFATIAIPVVGILGLVLFFNRGKHRKE
jgi:hypothetical protein